MNFSKRIKIYLSFNHHLVFLPLLTHQFLAHSYYLFLGTNLDHHHHHSHQHTHHHHIHPDFFNQVQVYQGNYLYPIIKFQGILHFNFLLSNHSSHSTSF